MKRFFSALFSLAAFTAQAQGGKVITTTYNDLTEIKGTEFVVASVRSWSKKGGLSGDKVLFINSGTGEQRMLEFPRRSYSDKIEQVRVEKLKINVVLISAHAQDPSGKFGHDYEAPRQLFAVSPDGSKRTQITDDHFYVSTWVANNETGVIVITGRQDSNMNGKADDSDETRILLYDLGTMREIAAR
jgi:hypothetical protein